MEVVAGRVSGSVARFKAAVEAVTALAAHGLVALEDDALLAARALAAPPASTSSPTSPRGVSEQITALRDALSPSRGYVVSQEYPGDDRDLVVVTVASAHGRQRVEELAEQLGSELETLKASISESEQQLMRKWIVDGLADALSVRLAEVREQVERTNRVLARCPTHFGIRVGLKWEVESEASDALRDTVELLGRGPGMLDADAQALLGTRLQQLIDAERDRGRGHDVGADRTRAGLPRVAPVLGDDHARRRTDAQAHQPPARGGLGRGAGDHAAAPAAGRRGRVLRRRVTGGPAGAGPGRGVRRHRRRARAADARGAGELDLDFMMASYKLRPFVPTHRFALINLRWFRSQRVVVGQRSVWTGSQLVPDD